VVIRFNLAASLLPHSRAHSPPDEFSFISRKVHRFCPSQRFFCGTPKNSKW
jgi:hypothetical protein